MRKRVFQRGDIVLANLNPTVGREQQSSDAGRPVLVLSSAAFNQTGVVMIAPITQGGEFSRFAGFAVSLATTGCKTQGVVLVNMTRSLDLEARGAKWVESVPEYVVIDALARIEAIFS